MSSQNNKKQKVSRHAALGLTSPQAWPMHTVAADFTPLHAVISMFGGMFGGNPSAAMEKQLFQVYDAHHRPPVARALSLTPAAASHLPRVTS